MLVLVITFTFLAISDGSRISDSHQESDSVLAEVLSRLEHLEAENRQLKTRLTETVDNLQAQADTIERLQEQVNDLSSKVNGCDGKSIDCKDDTHSLLDRLKTKVGQVRNKGIRQIAGYGVAFTAYLDHVETSLGDKQPIVYNEALLNDGNAYSTNTGIFRAPVPGVYLFSWSIMAKRRPEGSGYDVRVDLVRNTEKVVMAAAESQADNDDNQGSNTAIIRLAAGDEVWTHHRSGNSETYGSATDRGTSFSGVLLYEEEATVVG